MCIPISLTAIIGWPLLQLDVKKTFHDLQEVYMEQPLGFAAQRRVRFAISTSDMYCCQSVFSSMIEGGIVVIVYVDDIIIGDDTDDIGELKTFFQGQFHTKYLS